MNTSIKQRVGCILLSIFLVVCLIGSLLCAFILPFMSSNGVASADSAVGVVGDNLFTNPTFDLQGESLFNFQNQFSQDIVYTNGCTLRLGSNSTLIASTTASSVGHWMAFLFKPTSTGVYTFTINADFVGSSGYLWRLRDTNYTTYVDSQSVNFNNYQYVSFNITDLSKDYILQMLMPTQDVSTTIYWVKFEKGSTFTGYVPKDYTNYGYTQGYNEGVQDTNTKFNTLRGYSILSSPAHVLKYKYHQNGISNVNPGESVSTTYMPIANGDPPLLFTYNGVPYAFGNPTSSLIGRPFYSYSADYGLGLIGQVVPSGYTTFQIGYNVPYDGTNLYFCKGSFVWDPSYRLVAQTVDTMQYVFLDQFVANVYFSNIAAMDLSSYLQSGQIYNFYIYKSSLETAWNLTTYNTFYTGINSICFVKVENNDVIGQSSYNEGRADGFEQGKLTGYYEGWADGYAQGELVAPSDGQYTFLGVIGALFDAPVNSLKTFLDFDLLGFNMKSFVFAMLTLAFIVLIIRLILGSKS